VPILEVAYLGPEGTYAHLVAQKRFGRGARLRPLPSIRDVCTFAAGRTNRRGIVPIENSSGGAIPETVDILMAGSPRVAIQEELTLNVKLALLGRKGQPIRTLYSHFVPLDHCGTWIRKHLPGVRKESTPSTAAAAKMAHEHPATAALGGRRLAAIYGLQVLVYPVQADLPNITAFLLIGAPPTGKPRRCKTTLAACLLNQPGSLCSFLDTFRSQNVNLSRIISRPVRGSPREYAFMVDIDGHTASPPVAAALKAARLTCAELRVVGSYPMRRPYSS
jgi:prephenate dehydratase